MWREADWTKLNTLRFPVDGHKTKSKENISNPATKQNLDKPRTFWMCGLTGQLAALMTHCSPSGQHLAKGEGEAGEDYRDAAMDWGEVDFSPFPLDLMWLQAGFTALQLADNTCLSSRYQQLTTVPHHCILFQAVQLPQSTVSCATSN
jgi:hypothetical protein